jgi:probable F420-dependent oxidoreductase
MKLWYHAGFTPMDQLLGVAKHLDDRGFTGIALTHHLVNLTEVKATYPYSPDGKAWWDPGTPVPDVWVTAAAIGAVTTKLLIGPSVFILPMQDPFTVAKGVSTAAYFTNDRVICGIGAGWMKDEFDLVGLDFSNRGARTDEMIEVLQKLFSRELVEHHGTFYEFEPLRMEPMPSTPIPIWVGGHSPAAIRRAALLDGWHAPGPSTPDEVIALMGLMNAARDRAGTLDRPFESVMPVFEVPSKRDWERMEAAGATGITLVPAYADGLVTLDDRRRYIDGVAELAAHA